MKHLVLLSLLFVSFTSFAQTSIDKNPGILDIKVGTSFASVQSNFSAEQKDEESGEPFYAVKDVKSSKYATVFGEKVEEIRVVVEDGVIAFITVIYPTKAKFSTVTTNAAKVYGTGHCAIGVEDAESGGCAWDGEQCSLTIQNMDYPSIYAVFSVSYGEE